MDYLRELTLRRKKAHARLIKMKSATYQKFLELEKSAFRVGELSLKMKELIAVGISAGVGCEPCIQWHTEYALKHGATEQEILEALEVAMEIGGGKAISTARLAIEVMDKIKNGDYDSAEY
jgi:AhpD family alkylhydroperoxidase